MMFEKSDYSNIIEVAPYLVDDRVGIIHEVQELPREPGAPSFFYFYAKACNTKAFCGQENFGETGGAAVRRGNAMAKAIGEAVERYCAAIYDKDDLPLAAYETAEFRCVSPRKFALYNPIQYATPGFQFIPFEERTSVRWVQAIDGATGHTWYVPAAMVHIPYFYNIEQGESPIVQPISTGLACHATLTKSRISALCEVIERDAFMITWQARLSRPQIRIETLSEENRDLVNRFTHTGSSVTILDITVDVGIPTILTVLNNASYDAPALVFAASAHPDPEQATRKSLEEVAHTRVLAQHLKRETPSIATDPTYTKIINQDDHVRFYADHENAHLADFILDTTKHIDFEEIENLTTGNVEGDLERIIKKVNSVDHQVLLADITTCDVRELGLFVTRAIIPGFHPLFMGYGARALGGSRLWSVPQKLGYGGINQMTGDYPVPHPYP